MYILVVSTGGECVNLSLIGSPIKQRTTIKHACLLQGHLRSADFRRKRTRTTGLLQTRELHGRLIPFNGSRFNFEQEYEKVKVSHPLGTCGLFRIECPDPDIPTIVGPNLILKYFD